MFDSTDSHERDPAEYYRASVGAGTPAVVTSRSAIARAAQELTSGIADVVLRFAPDSRSHKVLRRLPGRFRPGLRPSHDRTLEYQDWLRRHALSEHRVRALRETAEQLRWRPVVSIVVPVYNTRPDWLIDAIESVRRQIYPHWELCLADDASSDDATRAVLAKYERLDARIQVIWRSERGGIAAASNDALAKSSGELIAFLDHDDELRPDALVEVVRHWNDEPDVDFVYTDEEKKDENGRLIDPFFKPDWSPDLLFCKNFVTHLSVYRKDVLDRIGGFREGYDGSQDWDLILRVTELTDRIGHVAKPLYTWRVSPGSTASDIGAKTYAWEAGKRAIRDAIERRGLRGRVEDGMGLSYRVRWQVTRDLRVAVLLLAARGEGEALSSRLDSVRARSSYPYLEVVVIAPQDSEPATRATLASLDARVIRYGGDDISAVVNAGAEDVSGSADVFIVLPPRTEVRSDAWIEALLEHGQRDDVAAVGPRLFTRNGRVLQEGVVIGMRGAAAGVDHEGYFSMGETVRNLAAVSSSGLLTRTSVFGELGGFDESFPGPLAAVDYCLRARERGYLVMFTPYAELTAVDEFALVAPESMNSFAERWSGYRDPYYNPNFSLVSPFRLALDS